VRLACAGVLATTLLAAVPCGGAHAQGQPLDPARSHVGFEIQTRWGQRLRGEFVRHSGSVTQRPDGMRQVRLRIEAASVDIQGHANYTRFARGEGFFDAARHPHIEFVSHPYAPDLLRDGGPMAGRLRLRGVEREAVFRIEPAGCARPAVDCDVVAGGSIDRIDFGMDRWRVAIRDQVRFELRVRLAAGGDGGGSR
jgi:polyisoprenoid-binding protein YceI